MKITRSSTPSPHPEIYLAVAFVSALFAFAIAFTWKLTRKKTD